MLRCALFALLLPVRGLAAAQAPAGATAGAMTTSLPDLGDCIVRTRCECHDDQLVAGASADWRRLARPRLGGRNKCGRRRRLRRRDVDGHVVPPAASRKALSKKPSDVIRNLHACGRTRWRCTSAAPFAENAFRAMTLASHSRLGLARDEKAEAGANRVLKAISHNNASNVNEPTPDCRVCSLACRADQARTAAGPTPHSPHR